MVMSFPQPSRSKLRQSQWLEIELMGLLAASSSHTQRSLAARLGVSLGTVNAIIKRMLDAGILTAKQVSGARTRHLLLTASGKRLLSRSAPHYLSERTAEIERAARLLTDLQGVLSRRATT